MEESELEEGEACFYENNGGDENSFVDPDALTHIEEKIQDVLGHFRKDFEGGVSAENLGSKFGGYGSFLPPYQSSPSWSNPRTTPDVPNNNILRSPKNLNLEVGRQNSLVSSSTSLSARLGAAPTNSVLVPATRASIANVDAKIGTHPARAEESTLICKNPKKRASSSDQKCLKVRIKVGSENLSTQKNAEIYSGLGLDVSPSSSLDDSHDDSEGLTRDPWDASDESPTSIIQIMTSVPFHGGLLLSPLSDDLILLTEKDSLQGNSVCKPLSKAFIETSGVMLNGSGYTVGNGKILEERKLKSFEKNANCNDNGIQDSVGLPSKKEIDVGILSCEDLISKTLKLPLLMSSCTTVSDPIKHSKPVDSLRTDLHCMVKEESLDGAPKDVFQPISGMETDRTEKSNRKGNSCGGAWESKKSNRFDNSTGYSNKEGNYGVQADVSANARQNKDRKALNTDFLGIPELSGCWKVALNNEDDLKLANGKEQVTSGGKKKLRGSQVHDADGGKVLNDGFVTDSSLTHKRKKSSSSNTSTSTHDSDDFKNHIRAKSTYRELFGDLEVEAEDEIGLGKMHKLEMPNDSGDIGKTTLVEYNDTVKERSNASKIEKSFASAEQPRLASDMNAPCGNVTNLTFGPSDPTAEAPVLKEDWVMCDKCQTWRLLPFGIDPRSLPKKWHCRMLDWLPGMNHCGISEEETTKALRSLHQFHPAATTASTFETENNDHQNPGGNLLGVASVDDLHSNHMHVTDASGKKKHGSKVLPNENKQDCPTQFSDKTNENFQAIQNNNSLNNTIQSSVDENRYHKYSGQSNTSMMEKGRQKQKERKKLLNNHSDGGDKNAKLRNKNEKNLESSTASKKMKRDDLNYNDENWIVDIAGEKTTRSSSNSLSRSAFVKDQNKNKYKDSNIDEKKSVVPDRSPQIHLPLSSSDGSVHVGKCDIKDSFKKRKENECQYAETCNKMFPGVGCNSRDTTDLVEEMCENDQRKGKKGRKSHSVMKDSSGKKSNEGNGERGRSKEQQQVVGQHLDGTMSQQSLDAMGSLKRGLRPMGTLQPSPAATSSSSEFSGLQKNKTSLQELRASPVESVSSSPLRIPTSDKFVSTMSLDRKDDCQDAGLFSVLSPRRSSDGEDDGSRYQYQILKKDQNLDVRHQGSFSGHMPCAKLSQYTLHSPDTANPRDAAVRTDPLPQGDHYAFKAQNLEKDLDDKDGRNGHHHNNSGIVLKSGKGSSSRPKDRSQSYRSDYDKGTDNESSGQIAYSGKKLKAGQNKFQDTDRSGIGSDKIEKKPIPEKDPSRKSLNKVVKALCRSKCTDNNCTDVRMDGSEKQALLSDSDDGRLTKKPFSDKEEGIASSGRGKPLPVLADSGKIGLTAGLHPVSGSQKDAANLLSVDTFEGDASKAKQGKEDHSQSRDQPTSLQHNSPNIRKFRDLDAPSPARREPSSQAATNAVKEATNLKHLADRQKNSGSSESTSLYFQAALKFLHGASLFESCNTDSMKHNEMTQSRQIYSSTAKLCEFCAHEYERSKDMAAAALAYKCMEVAYMRVIYFSHTSANRYRNELQAALQIFPPGESPPSSASDVDNLNNPLAVDKVASAKGVGSPQVTVTQVITARNRSNFMRLLNFAQEVSLAMDASRKSRAAFAAANPRKGEALCKEAMLSVRKALDFNFQDVDGFLRLVRIAMEAI
ncbi:PREDICTED: uncharacterized protein LOC109182758 [Ipomoea nil]|uniref:uncharacterized protein LOC109182758 n=1 Tax=Ipomoea nil TaxID=35883 RepID=UPI000900B65E|nr:PREDICTED: uncharacterized protein LOC109182758 [Ipomoea nil]XP_019188485.1 PREDICTED: uncharacterized protein LOC109182758 [Ipomoea nil]XP_019188486.1 PREDICTED: uncharacterized protein LOC109182758 [Ipomoea nil]XP_019188487.1 PREDICTED: uncharacterized protein LOC109182758 [Ipomoea nil]XP_019188488.1 PREDICTED: uncharacterized protein LOC109182758 [Ipomoea nil]XP_019188489.1 PREDICTED: uncharacterized protein LOC109182758 [Ipomoea nil]